jgi:hypothetical protein
MTSLLKRLVSLSLVLASTSSVFGCADVDADGVSTESEDAVTLKWLARGVTVGQAKNRVPNIPIVGKEYTATTSLYAVSADGIPGKAYRGAILVNPGAVVGSADQKTFAETLAAKGYIVYVANNPVDNVKEDQGGPARGPIPLFVGNLIPDLARQLSTDPSRVDKLPPAIVAAHRAWNTARTPKLVAIGHSLGGAVLGSAAKRTDTGLSRIILIGVDELVDAGFPFGLSVPESGKATPVPLVFVRGEFDGLAEGAKTRELAKKYPNSQVLPDLKGVNHFCFIDGTVGAPGKRKADRASTLSTQACVDATIEALKGKLD